MSASLFFVNFVSQSGKRSVIFVWYTAEEKGLVGAYYFVQHCPVPVEKIRANLNLDMVSRNDPGMIYLIGSDKLSTELDAAIHAANQRSVRLRLDYTYESPAHPDSFFFRSDQLPYIRYGIPGVWFFSGTTPDYHQETDLIERCDFAKMEKVTKLVYLTAMDNGNKPALLKLDISAAIRSRGAVNMTYDWRKHSPTQGAIRMDLRNRLREGLSSMEKEPHRREHLIAFQDFCLDRFEVEFGKVPAGEEIDPRFVKGLLIRE